MGRYGNTSKMYSHEKICKTSKQNTQVADQYIELDSIFVREKSPLAPTSTSKYLYTNVIGDEQVKRKFQYFS